MTAGLPNPTPDPQLPSQVKAALTIALTHGMTGAAALLTGYGVIQKSQDAEFVDIGVAVSLWVASWAVTQIMQHLRHKQAVAVVATVAAKNG